MADRAAPAAAGGVPPTGAKRVMFTVEPVKEKVAEPAAAAPTMNIISATEKDASKQPPEASKSAPTITPAPIPPPQGVVLTTQKSTTESKPASSDSEDEDQNEILEESPCGRWWKRREQVKQRDVPGIDVAYLAMDNETGNEVVWNEVQFSERKNFRAQEEKIKAIFDNLTQLHHTNLVTFHKYWTDAKSEKPRVIFITEYMSSGSMSQFMKRTRKGSKSLSEKAWKKWCTQILSALTYLHSSDQPIVHGNLSCNTIFIQQNGLIKIGCVAPSTIHHHVKTFRDNMRNMHYIAPEYELGTTVTPAADIYAFGICALEMASLGFVANGAQSADGKEPAPTTSVVSQDTIQNTLSALENHLMKDFITRCLRVNPTDRPTARELLFHSALFEVHSLLLMACHKIVKTKIYDQLAFETFNIKPEEKEKVYATCGKSVFRYADVPHIEVDKFLEDVRNGIYPLTAFSVPLAQKVGGLQQAGSTGTSSSASEPALSAIGGSQQQNARSSGSHATDASSATLNESSNKSSTSSEQKQLSSNSDASNGGKADKPTDKSLLKLAGASNQPSSHSIACPERANSPSDSEKPDAQDMHVAVSAPALKASENESEHRKILRMSAELKESDNGAWTITLLLKLEDTMNRQLTAEISDTDTAEVLVDELVIHGFIHEADKSGLTAIIAQTLTARDLERDERKDSITTSESGNEDNPAQHNNNNDNNTSNVNGLMNGVHPGTAPSPHPATTTRNAPTVITAASPHNSTSKSAGSAVQSAQI